MGSYFQIYQAVVQGEGNPFSRTDRTYLLSLSATEALFVLIARKLPLDEFASGAAIRFDRPPAASCIEISKTEVPLPKSNLSKSPRSWRVCRGVVLDIVTV